MSPLRLLDFGFWISDLARKAPAATRDAAPPRAGEELTVKTRSGLFATLRPKDYEDLMYLLGEPGVLDLGRATALVHLHLGGRFASDQFAAAIEEARWRHGKDRK